MLSGLSEWANILNLVVCGVLIPVASQLYALSGRLSKIEGQLEIFLKRS